MNAASTRPLSDLAVKILHNVPAGVLNAYRAGYLGREVYDECVAAAAYRMITAQDEGVDLWAYVAKIEAAVAEILCPTA